MTALVKLAAALSGVVALLAVAISLWLKGDVPAPALTSLEPVLTRIEVATPYVPLEPTLDELKQNVPVRTEMPPKQAQSAY